MDWMSLSSTNLYTETLLSEGWFLKMEGFGGWLGHEGGALLMGLVKKREKSLLPHHQVRIWEKKPASEPLLDTGSAGTLILNFPHLEPRDMFAAYPSNLW